ncbi:U6 snRNA-associated Sm-like protein LSm5 [Colletotrichum cuscutae]|uniref:U6 snRNA-associated Sm-like protein LSm5 n=1 Tax=Colletotrichum cuscutae TaxID=1209917 RepID=A0AAI9VDN4_9PEZI|nr:U6 snRNA-associated Sm-like protein LSm5 [Colletotrichum cuscutae]
MGRYAHPSGLTTFWSGKEPSFGVSKRPSFRDFKPAKWRRNCSLWIVEADEDRTYRQMVTRVQLTIKGSKFSGTLLGFDDYDVTELYLPKILLNGNNICMVRHVSYWQLIPGGEGPGRI